MQSGLAQRIALTLGALLLYRLGLQIPLPGLDAAHVGALVNADATRRVSVFAIGIAPYVMAAVILQIVGVVWRRVRMLGREGHHGRAILSRWTWNIATLLAAAQSLAIARALTKIDGLVAAPEWLFVISAALTLTGGALFLAWLTEWITARGVGNGIALVLFVDSVAGLPRVVAAVIEYGRQFGTMGPFLAVLLAIAAVVVLIVAVELARRRLEVRFPARVIDARTVGERSSFLSLKLNCAGIIPVLLASWIMAIAYAAVTAEWGGAAAVLRPGQPLYLTPYALLIILFAFIYTASVIDPDESAERLTTYGGELVEAAAGAAAPLLDSVVSRITVLGAAYLAFVCLLPEILFAQVRLPVYLAGPTLLLMVCTVLDVVAQVRAAPNTGSTAARPGEPRTD